VVRFYLATPAGIIRRDEVQIRTLPKEKRTSNDVLFSFGGEGALHVKSTILCLFIFSITLYQISKKLQEFFRTPKFF
jgi:hypothetical protein